MRQSNFVLVFTRLRFHGRKLRDYRAIMRPRQQLVALRVADGTRQVIRENGLIR